MRENNWLWVEGLFNRFHLPNLMVSSILACILIAIFTIFEHSLQVFDYGIPDLQYLYPESICPCPDCGIYNCTEMYLFELPKMMTNFVVALSMSSLIPFEFFAIKNLLDDFKNSLLNLKFNSEEDLPSGTWYKGVMSRFTSSPWKYLIVLSIVLQVFASFYIYYLNYGNKVFFYSDRDLPGGGLWGGLFDIYNRGLYVVIFYLLALILWILINISWSITDLERMQYKEVLRVNIINPDKFSELNQYKNLTLKGFTFFFLCISLTAFTDPSLLVNKEISYLNATLVILFLIGLSASLISIITIGKIRKHKLMQELRRLNEMYGAQYEELMDGVSNGVHGRYSIDLSALTAAMKALHDEKERIISKNRSGYDLKTIGTFIASILLPIASKIIQDFLLKGLK
jgi:hypothetical protein